MALETRRIDDPSIPLATDLADCTIPVMQGGVSKRLMAEQLIMNNTAYGVEFDNIITSPIGKRVGNPLLHQHLPIQSKMRRCVLRADGTVNYYLDPNNSLLKENGTAAKLDGTDGNVMVEFPEHYMRVDVVGTKVTRWISENQLQGFTKVNRMYVSAFKATVDRINLKLSSVMNTAAQYRGGDNSTAWDNEAYRTLLGRPATALTMDQARTYARNIGNAGLNGAGWNQYIPIVNDTIINLYLIEYANRNSQAPFNASLDANGYRQGGLGDGVTTLTSSDWAAFNNTRPFIPCGHTASLGNTTGNVPYVMPAEYPVPLTVQVPSYRGIEEPFGHIYTWLDGVKITIQADSEGGTSTLYECANPALINSNLNLTNYKKVGDLPRANGYIKEMHPGKPYPKVNVGAGSTTYWCDYFYTSIPATGTDYRGLFLGGSAATGAYAGLALSRSTNSLSDSATAFGFRLCFLPNP